MVPVPAPVPSGWHASRVIGAAICMPVHFGLDLAPVNMETTSIGEGAETVVGVTEIPKELGGEAVVPSCGVKGGLSTPSTVLRLTDPLPQIVEGGTRLALESFNNIGMKLRASSSTVRDGFPLQFTPFWVVHRDPLVVRNRAPCMCVVRAWSAMVVTTACTRVVRPWRSCKGRPVRARTPGWRGGSGPRADGRLLVRVVWGWSSGPVGSVLLEIELAAGQILIRRPGQRGGLDRCCRRSDKAPRSRQGVASAGFRCRFSSQGVQGSIGKSARSRMLWAEGAATRAAGGNGHDCPGGG